MISAECVEIIEEIERMLAEFFNAQPIAVKIEKYQGEGQVVSATWQLPDQDIYRSLHFVVDNISRVSVAGYAWLDDEEMKVRCSTYLQLANIYIGSCDTKSLVRCVAAVLQVVFDRLCCLVMNDLKLQTSLSSAL